MVFSVVEHLSGSKMSWRRGNMAERSPLSMGCGWGTVATFTGVTTMQGPTSKLEVTE